MDTEQQLAWEARFGRFAALAAYGAVLLSVVTLVFQARAIQAVVYHGHKIKTPTNQAQVFVLTDHQPGKYLITSIIGSLTLPLIGFVLYYLYRLSKARRAETPDATMWLVLIAPVVAMVLAIVGQIHSNQAARKFVHAGFGKTLGPAGEKYATHLSAEGAGTVLQIVGLVATLGIAIGFILVCVNAMRAGILSKAMAYFGMVVGALFFIPVLGPASAVLQIFWLGAIGALLINRWPGGRGPAWSTVEAIPWPTTADRRAQIEEQRSAAGLPPSGRGGFGRRPSPEPGPEPDTTVTGTATAVSETNGSGNGNSAASQHSRSKKRKRKRR